MKKMLIFSLLLLLFVCNFSAYAQEEDEVEKDILEMNFFGGIGSPLGDLKTWNDSLWATSHYNMGLDVGYFITTSIVAGFNFTYTDFNIDSDDDVISTLHHRLYSPNLYLKYYVPTDGNIVPYLKGSIGLDFAKFTTSVDNVSGSRLRQLSYDPAVSFGIGGGLFYYTHDYAGLFLEGNYHIAQTEEVEYNYAGEIGTFGNKLSTFDIHFGIRILFGSDE